MESEEQRHQEPSGDYAVSGGGGLSLRLLVTLRLVPLQRVEVGKRRVVKTLRMLEEVEEGGRGRGFCWIPETKINGGRLKIEV